MAQEEPLSSLISQEYLKKLENTLNGEKSTKTWLIID
jgi:hypothetical protein